MAINPALDENLSEEAEGKVLEEGSKLLDGAVETVGKAACEKLDNMTSGLDY